MNRVVSLLPSATEIVCALGCETVLVGRSHECDYPEVVKRLPVCTEPKFNPEGPSQEIDHQVKTLLQESLSVYRVLDEVLKGLQPDGILTQTQCEVCAVSLNDVERAVSDWLGAKPVIVSLSPKGLEDVWADMIRVADVLGIPERGVALKARLEERIAEITRKAETTAERPEVVCIEWIDPLMASANWMPDLVSLAGGRNLLGHSGSHAPWISWEAVKEKNPDVMVVLPCGFDIARIRQDLPSLTTRQGWSDLKAVRTGNVFLADGNHYFNRPGPRLVDSLEILAEIFHPAAFQFGHEGRGWERL